MYKKILVYLVSIAAFFGPFTQTIYVPMLPSIAEHFQASLDAVNLTVSIYPIFFAFMQLIYGPLIDKYGRRPILLLGFMVYLLATLGAALSYTIASLIIFRALQAIGVAVGSVAAITIIGDLYEGTMRGRSMGTYQMLVALGPGLGPIFGGFVGQHYNINGLFWILLGISLVFWLILWLSLPETRTPEAVNERFQLKQLTIVLNHRVGLAIIVLGSVQYAIFYMLLVLLPNIVDDVYHLNSSETGLIFLPISLFIIIGSIIGGRIQERFEVKSLLVIVASLHMIVVFLFALLASVSLTMLITLLSLFGLFLGISLPLQTTLLANELPRNRATSTGVYNFFRYVWMTIGPVIGTYLFWIGYRLEFLACGVIFAGLLLFVARNFFIKNL
ncbi:MFS transporter [Metasolibacillus meyeri]|uniref:MFS transporter n=1 Tax=Metasolibacillus meyeri TaxID=1071052 RepID=A0AAW9NS44_9BACL|nr:MFS transporter [Metasolibacillus meyeri]MEC1177566.1 MFS transporter [Metasolibacillus meyeri]